MTNLAAVNAFDLPTSASLKLVRSTIFYDPPKEELSIQIRNIDGVHVDHVDIREAS